MNSGRISSGGWASRTSRSVAIAPTEISVQIRSNWPAVPNACRAAPRRRVCGRARGEQRVPEPGQHGIAVPVVAQELRPGQDLIDRVEPGGLVGAVELGEAADPRQHADSAGQRRPQVRGARGVGRVRVGHAEDVMADPDAEGDQLPRRASGGDLPRRQGQRRARQPRQVPAGLRPYGCRAPRRRCAGLAVRGVRCSAGEQRADEHLRRAGGDDRVQLADQRRPRQPVHDLHPQRGRCRAAARRGRLGQLIGQVPHPVAVAAGGGLVELAEVGVQDRSSLIRCCRPAAGTDTRASPSARVRHSSRFRPSALARPNNRMKENIPNTSASKNSSAP